MTKTLQREKALELRKKGWSIKDIAKRLVVSQSTTSYWCRDILLTATQVKHLQKKSWKAGVEALMLASERKRQKRLLDINKYMQQGAKDAGHLTKRDLFMVGLGLYWGEGYQQKSDEVGFTNSNPAIILLFIKWLQEIFDVTVDRLILRVSINEIHRERQQKVLQHWSHLTAIPEQQFTKTSLIKSIAKKRYTNHDEYYGTLRVKVRKGTNLKRRIIGSISALK